MSVIILLQAYAHRIRELRRANADVPEPALAPAFQTLLAGSIPLLPVAQRLAVVPEFLTPGVGRPDIALKRLGAPPRAFVELKAPAKPADPVRWRGQDQRQFERFKELPCWAACNFAEFRLLNRDEDCGSAVVVPEQTLRPTVRLLSMMPHPSYVWSRGFATRQGRSRARAMPRISRH